MAIRVLERQLTDRIELPVYTVPVGEGFIIIPDLDWNVAGLVITIEMTTYDPTDEKRKGCNSIHVCDVVCPFGDATFVRAISGIPSAAMVQHLRNVHGWTTAQGQKVLGKTGAPSLGYLHPPDGLKALTVISASSVINMGAFLETFPKGRT